MTNQSSQSELEERRAAFARLSVYTGIGVLAAGGILISCSFSPGLPGM